MTRAILCLIFATALLPFVSSMASPAQKVAVIGATGRLGRQAVMKLAEEDIPCKILVRKEPSKEIPTDLTSDLDSSQVAAYLASLNGVDVVKGDVTDQDSLNELLEDSTACLSLFGATRRSKFSDIWTDTSDTDPTHAKQVNYVGVQNILKAAKLSGTCKRIVRITGKGESPTSLFSILINMLGGMAKAWNYEGERVLRGQTDIEYTIIRPGIMAEEGPKGGVLTLADNGADLPVAKIRYADIAQLSIDCLSYPNAGRSTLTAMTVEEGGAATYAPLLETVRADSRQFPSDMFAQHKAAVQKAVAALLGGGIVALAIMVQLILKVLL